MKRLLRSAALACLAAAPCFAQDDATETKALSGTFALDLPSAYFFRGIRQEDEGLIVQPSLELAWRVYESADDEAPFAVDLLFGTWHSFHRGPTGARGGGDAWYEADLFTGASIAFDERWNLAVQWARFGNPNATWTSMEECTIGLSFDDCGSFGADFAGLQPSLVFAAELAGQGDGGSARGTYLQLGVEPSLELTGEDAAQPFTLSIPFAIGLGLDSYYERPSDGADRRFGFADLGAVISTPVPFLRGAWETSVGVHALWLGAATEEMNGGDVFQWIASFGVSAAF